jgi:hypothetical protein
MGNDEDAPLVGTLADEEAAMRKGKAGQLVLLGGFALALLGGLMFLMGGDDEARVYGDLGKKINGLKQAHFDQFWGCALQGEDLRDVRSNSDLEAQLDARGAERGQAYGVHLREECMPKVADLSPELDTLIAPADLAPHVEAMSDANGRMRSAVSAFIAYLDDPELEYDEAQADEFIGQIARGWYDFKKAYGAANDAVREKVTR